MAQQPAAPAVPRHKPAAAAGQRPPETIRVDSDRLDHLMDLAGQLVINKAQLAQIGDKLRTTLAGRPASQAVGESRPSSSG